MRIIALFCINAAVFALSVFANFSYAQEYLREETKREIALLRRDIGKKFWVSADRVRQKLCQSSTYRPNEKCQPLEPGSWFIVKDLVMSEGTPAHDPVVFAWRFFKVVTSDNRTGYIQADFVRPHWLTEDPLVTAKKEQQRREEQEQSRQAAVEECRRRGQPKIGMSQAEAIATCWGKPLRVVTTTTAAGIQEDYEYGGGHLLRFQNGVLSTILETK